jgi:DNA helicase-2/ATP-dependent DNA helicase PcrA
MSFEERYKNLNPRQREAVDTIEGPVMVIAGPGTGKTTILTLRIANILKKTDTPPSGILAITYTDAGAKNMRVKLRELIGSRADEVRIHTFHGFASSVINEFREHFPHLSKSEQITDVEAEAIVRKILADAKFADIRPFGNPDMYIGPILGAIRDSKKEAWAPDMLRSFAKDEAKRVTKDPESISTRGASKGELKADAKKRIERLEKTTLLADVYEQYEAEKKGKYIDFDDQIIELMVALERDELLLRLLQEKFLYILVDEHQDTNDSQNLLIRMIADFFETPNLFVVGDEKQAIYRFQGASVQNFLRFQNVWKNMKVISLEDNYRSHQGILDAGFAMIENNYAEGEHEVLRIALKSGAKTGGPVDVITAGNIAAEEAWLAEAVSKVLKTDKTSTVAVIVRKNRLVERALSALESRGVKAAAERGADIFSHPTGSLFFDLIGFLNDPSYTEGLARTLAAGLWNIEFDRAAEIIGLLRAGKPVGIEKRIPAAAELQRVKATSGALAYIVKAAEVSGLVEAIALDPLAVEVWRGIITLSEEIARRSSIEDPSKLMTALLSYATSAESRSVKVSLGAPDARATIMTAHSSKGLEFDYVFMPYSTEDAWMSQRRGPSFILPREAADKDDIRDTRRLFYVALTRARKHVVISSSTEGAGGKETLPVRFISEIPENLQAKVSLPAVKDLVSLRPSKNLSTQEEILADFARRSLAEKGLSVTALNHFIACPARYFYKSVMRLPEAPSASAEKGNAMHAALDAVWKLPTKDTKTIESQIISTVTEYFNTRSLLPAFERQSIVEKLVHDAPAVAAALTGHFLQTPPAVSETPVESKRGDIRIHGKLDALVVGDSTVSIFDYKTREAMSENEIRGLTKDATGDYFRQLVFYKLLLVGDIRTRGKSIEPSLVFVSPDAKGRCPIITLPISKKDEDTVLAYIDRLVEAVRTGSVVRGTCDDSNCKECTLRRFIEKK